MRSVSGTECWGAPTERDGRKPQSCSPLNLFELQPWHCFAFRGRWAQGWIYSALREGAIVLKNLGVHLGKKQQPQSIIVSAVQMSLAWEVAAV